MSVLIMWMPCIFQHLSSFLSMPVSHPPNPLPELKKIVFFRLFYVIFANQPLQPVLLVFILCSEIIYWKASGYKPCNQRAWIQMLTLMTFSFFKYKVGIILLTSVMKNK